MWLPGRRKAVRMLDEPSEKQAEIMGAFGWKTAGVVLRKI
jgi:predicted NAD/FAD-binding protein